MLFKKPLAKILNAFTNKPISEKTLTIMDITVTLIGTLATIVGIFVALQFGIVSSLVIAVAILLVIPIVFILTRMMNPSTISPYTPWTPVMRPRFVGRKKLLNQLEHALNNNESISLVGDRRMGKTSVLKTWAQVVQQKRWVLYITGEEAEATTLSFFVNKITQQQAVDEPDAAANLLSEWAETIKGQAHFPPLILVDEAERFIEKFPPRFFERLRGMLGRVVWVFASREDIDLIYKRFHSTTSPFENRLQILRLGLLEPEAAEEIISWGDFSVEAAVKMGMWAGRHPFFLQLLGRCLVEAGGDENIQAALDEFQTEAAVRLRRIWSHLNKQEKLVLKRSITGKKVTLRSLRVRGLVTEDGKLFGKVLVEWLKEKGYEQD
jgi:hypothetical protein